MSAAHSNVVKALTFPRTRRAFADLILRGKAVEPLVLRVIFWWGASLVLLTIHALLRGMMDDLGAPVQGAGWEKRVFGSVPTIWLQANIWPLAPGLFKWLAVVIHSSWFVVPMLAAVFVSFRRPARVGSLFRWWILLELAVLPAFALFPLRPPWMDEPEVTRVIALVFGERVNDSNPVAAMPSMHVAFPLVIGLWFTRERWYGPAALMIGYSGLISSEVVFSGEHYIIDVLAAGVVAILVATVASLNYQPIRARIGRVLFAERRLVLDPVPIARSAREGERGQTLVEMAFALPVILVFVMLMVDIGFAVDRREVVQHGVREGARYGAVGNSAAAITTHANQESGGTLSSVQVCYIDENGNGNPGNAGDTVRVTGQYTYDFMIGNGTFFDGAFPSVSMTPSSQARLEKSVPFASDC